jgi:hypothetical protein
VILDSGGVVFREAHVDGAERRDCAPDANRPIDRRRSEPTKTISVNASHIITYGVQLAVDGGVARNVALRKVNTAERKADKLSPLVPIPDDDLRAPATDVDDHRAAGRGVRGARDREKYEPSLFLTGENFDRITDSLGEATRNLVSIGGGAHGAGGGDADVARAAVLGLLDEPFQAFERSEHGGFVDGAGAVEPLTEAGDLAHAMGGAEAVVGIDIGDEQSDGIRSDVDGADSNGAGGRGRRGRRSSRMLNRHRHPFG